MIIPLIPHLSTTMQATPFEVGLLVAVYSGMQFVLSPVWGAVSDRIGRRPILLASLFMAAVAHLIFAFSTQLWMLFVARAVAGLCAANISTAFAYMADITRPNERSKAMGIVGAAFGLGFVVGPFLGGMGGVWGSALGSSAPYGPQFAALLASVLCGINFLLACKILVESNTSCMGLSAWWARLMWARSTSKRSTSKQPTSKGSTVLRHMLSSSGLQKYKNHFCANYNKTTSLLLSSFFLYALAMATIEMCLFLFLEQKFKWSVTQMSFGFAYVGLVMVVVQAGLVRWVFNKWGEAWVLVGGVGVFAASMLCFVWASSLMLLAVGATGVGLGHGFAHTAFTGSLSLLSQQQQQGFSLGVQHSVSALTRLLGPLIGGLVYTYKIELPFVLASLLCALSLILIGRVFAALPCGGHNKN